MTTAVLELAKGCRVCGCAQAQRTRSLGLEHRHRCTILTGYTAGAKRVLKSAAAEDRRVRAGSHRFSRERLATATPDVPKCASEIGQIRKTGSVERLGYECFKSATTRTLANEQGSRLVERGDLSFGKCTIGPICTLLSIESLSNTRFCSHAPY
jgi:hypothetical protein